MQAREDLSARSVRHQSPQIPLSADRRTPSQSNQKRRPSSGRLGRIENLVEKIASDLKDFKNELKNTTTPQTLKLMSILGTLEGPLPPRESTQKKPRFNLSRKLLPVQPPSSSNQREFSENFEFFGEKELSGRRRSPGRKKSLEMKESLKRKKSPGRKESTEKRGSLSMRESLERKDPLAKKEYKNRRESLGKRESLSRRESINKRESPERIKDPPRRESISRKNSSNIKEPLNRRESSSRKDPSSRKNTQGVNDTPSRRPSLSKRQTTLAKDASNTLRPPTAKFALRTRTPRPTNPPSISKENENQAVAPGFYTSKEVNLIESSGFGKVTHGSRVSSSRSRKTLRGSGSLGPGSGRLSSKFDQTSGPSPPPKRRSSSMSREISQKNRTTRLETPPDPFVPAEPVKKPRKKRKKSTEVTKDRLRTDRDEASVEPRKPRRKSNSRKLQSSVEPCTATGRQFDFWLGRGRRLFGVLREGMGAMSLEFASRGSRTRFRVRQAVWVCIFLARAARLSASLAAGRREICARFFRERTERIVSGLSEAASARLTPLLIDFFRTQKFRDLPFDVSQGRIPHAHTLPYSALLVSLLESFTDLLTELNHRSQALLLVCFLTRLHGSSRLLPSSRLARPPPNRGL